MCWISSQKNVSRSGRDRLNQDLLRNTANTYTTRGHGDITYYNTREILLTLRSLYPLRFPFACCGDFSVDVRAHMRNSRALRNAAPPPNFMRLCVIPRNPGPSPGRWEHCGGKGRQLSTKPCHIGPECALRSRRSHADGDLIPRYRSQ